MPDAPLQVELGAVETLISNLQFALIMNEGGDAHLQVYAATPSDAKKRVVVVMLDANGYERPKAIIRGADDVIDRMIRAERVKRMVPPY